MKTTSLRNLTLAVFTAASFCAGCDPEELGPLSYYNDSWEGQIVFDGQQARPFKADLLVTQVMEDWSASTQTNKRGFADLHLGSDRLAGRAAINHLDVQPNKSTRSSIAGSERIQIDVASVIGAAEDAVDPAASIARYGVALTSVLTSMGLQDLARFTADPQAGLVALWGKREGDAIEGQVIVRFPDAPDNAREVPRGSFRLVRIGPTSAVQTSREIIETDAFRFRNKETATGPSVAHTFEILAK